MNLYETDFPGMYVTEDGYYVDEYNNVYTEDGEIIQEGIFSKIGGLFKKKAAPAASEYVVRHQNNLNKIKGLAAKSSSVASKAGAGIDNLNNSLLAKNARLLKMAEGCMDLYETEYPGIYMMENGYFVDSDGSVYNEDGEIIVENAVAINELFGGSNLNSYQQQHNNQINSAQRKNFVKGMIKQQAYGTAGMAGGAAAGGMAGKVIGSMNRFKGKGLGARGAIVGGTIGAVAGMAKPTYQMLKTHHSLQQRKY